MRKSFRMAISGSIAGIVNGIFGAGGGMIFVPLLRKFNRLPDRELFPASLSVMLPVCAVTALLSLVGGDVDFGQATPYLIGSVIGGFLVTRWGHEIPTVWLHRVFGVLILWGGIRYLC